MVSASCSLYALLVSLGVNFEIDSSAGSFLLCLKGDDYEQHRDRSCYGYVEGFGLRTLSWWSSAALVDLLSLFHFHPLWSGLRFTLSSLSWGVRFIAGGRTALEKKKSPATCRAWRSLSWLSRSSSFIGRCGGALCGTGWGCWPSGYRGAGADSGFQEG